MTGIIWGVFLLFILGTLLAIGIAIYNRLVFIKNQCDRAWANIDVILKQRHDELPKLIKICEEHMKFERGTLEKVVQARSAAFQASGAGVNERARLEGELSTAVGRLLAVVEQYPELKTIQMFTQLQGRITSLEGELADRREVYNDAVTNYNIAIETVPSNFIANMSGFRHRDLFKVAEADKEDVEIKMSQP
jgi:LemA protein